MTNVETPDLSAPPALNPGTAAAAAPDDNPARPAALLASAAAATALLAACGGGSESSEPAPLVVVPLPAEQISGFRFASATNDEEGARFLQQAQFSSTREEIAAVRSDNFPMWLARQYQTPLRSNGWDWLESQGYGAVDTNEYYFSTRPADHMLWNQLLSGPDAMRKRMALALSEFFVSSMTSAEFTWRSHAYASWWDMLVRNAFGNYRQLLEDVTLHPAMGYFLNTKGNRKEDTRTGRVPDENYSREVMQLFTIGLVNLNLDGSSRGTESYTQDDVTNLARVFTGYDFDRSDGVRLTRPNSTSTIESHAFARKPMSLTASNHSTLEARFLGARVPENASGAEALRIAMDTLFNHPNVGPFFARQMIQRLVTSHPSPAYVARVASRFNDNGAGVRGDLQAVWTAILLDDEARRPDGRTDPTFGKLREPMLRFIQWGRSFGVRSAANTWKIGDLSGASNQLGQSPLRSPSVFNFFRPGYVPPSTSLATAGATAPEFQIVNETSVGGYLNFMQNTIDRGVADVTADYARELALVQNAQALVDHVCLVLGAGSISTVSRAVMVSALEATPITASSTADVRRRRVLAAIFMVMGCPEYLVQK
ncbi:MAG: DUF1800 domain-containing protein [Hydrogenophaga sp.]|uniref:DUF1800 domain-containing protein n=1 Tax=Hydrogenophaga sp. TaxID=1904254 RepID=UPI00260A2A0D|nr:DUF1800 domain-containing protein [Hydrogenophaga sp.]MDM7942122.1 DUF1800 domain-containing protein [Hydrogenophaga sp.]